MSFKILKDGEIKAEFEEFNDAWTCILKSQSQSVDWAVKYEGWNVQMSNGDLVRPLSRRQRDLYTKAKEAPIEVIERNIQLFKLELEEYNDPKNIPNCYRMREIGAMLEVFFIVLREMGV